MDLPLVDAWTLLGRIPVALGMLFLVIHVARRGRPLHAAAGVVGFAAGLIAGTAALPSIVGALVGGVTGWGLGLRWAGCRVPWAYAMTRLLLVLGGVGRLGCLLAGCCFGATTSLPWAVRHPVGSFAHHLHVGLGWVGPDDAALPVHPVPLYESVVLLAAALALPALRRRIRDDRTLALGTAAGYLLLRAAVDPLRAMVNTRASAQFLGTLSVAQIGFLVGALLLAVLAVGLRRIRIPAAPEGGVERAAAVWAASAGAVALTSHSATPFLVLFCLGTFALSALVLVHQATLDYRPARRWATPLALGALLLIPAGLRAGSGEDAGRFWARPTQCTDCFCAWAISPPRPRSSCRWRCGWKSRRLRSTR